MNRSIFFPDFDQSLRRYGISGDYYRVLLEEEDFDRYPQLSAGREMISFFRTFKEELKNNYERLSRIPLKDTGETTIPRIIHQIWLGGKPPERLESARKTWLGWKGWKYKLWTDETISSLTLHNKEIFDSLTNIGERADLLRYEILLQQGGVYIDMDCVCLQPHFFDLIHFNYDFYVGLEPIETAGYRISCCNAIIGTCPRHPILHELVYDLPANIKAFPDNGKMTWQRTGPIYFTKLISENLSSGRNKNMIFPPTVFYPVGFHDIRLSQEEITELIHKESVAIHLWEGKWKG